MTQSFDVLPAKHFDQLTHHFERPVTEFLEGRIVEVAAIFSDVARFGVRAGILAGLRELHDVVLITLNQIVGSGKWTNNEVHEAEREKEFCMFEVSLPIVLIAVAGELYHDVSGGCTQLFSELSGIPCLAGHYRLDSECTWLL